MTLLWILVGGVMLLGLWGWWDMRGVSLTPEKPE